MRVENQKNHETMIKAWNKMKTVSSAPSWEVIWWVFVREKVVHLESDLKFTTLETSSCWIELNQFYSDFRGSYFLLLYFSRVLEIIIAMTPVRWR